MELFLVIIVTFFQLVVGVIASISKLTKDDNSQYPRNLTVSGWLLMLSILICFAGSISLYFVSDNKKEELELKIETRDSLNRIYNDSMHLQTVELLARYGLKVDSSSNEIIKVIRDSSKSTTIIAGVDPYVHFCDNSVSLNSYLQDSASFNIQFCNLYARAAQVNINLYCIGVVDGKYNLVEGTFIPIINANMRVGEYSGGNFSVVGFRNVNQFFFYAKGSYFNSDNSKKFPIDQLVVFNVLQKTTTGVNGYFEQEIRSFLKQKKIE